MLPFPSTRLTALSRTDATWFGLTIFHFFEFCFVVGAEGVEPAIPPEEVETVITGEILVVLVVAHGGIDPLADGVF